MIRGLRIDDAPRLQQLIGANQRLLMRVGALLQQKIAISETVLSSLESVNGLSELILDRRLGASTSAVEDLISQHCGEEAGLLLSDNNDGWRVLAFVEEIDNPLLQQSQGSAEDQADPAAAASGSLAALIPSAPAALQPVLHSLLAAVSDGERAAAVEQLRYHSPSAQVLVALIPLFLADGASAVREAARRLLKHSGARPVIGRLLDHFHDQERRGLSEIIDELGDLSGSDGELAIAAITGGLEQGASGQDMIALANALAPALAGSPQLPNLLSLALHHGDALSLLGLVRKLQQHAGERVRDILLELFGSSREGDARLFSLLVGPGDTVERAQLERAIALLLSSNREPVDRMPIAAALTRCANHEEAVDALCAAVAAGAGFPDSASIWLIGEWARLQHIQAAQAAVLLPPILLCCESGSGPQVTTLLEQHLPARLPLDRSQAGTAIIPLGELAARSRSPRSIELLTAIMKRLAPGNAEPLWQLIEEHPHQQPRLLALGALPAALDDAHSDEICASIQRLLRCRQRASSGRRGSEEDSQREAALICTIAARLLQLPQLVAPPELVAAVDDTASRLGPYGWLALGIVVAGTHCDPRRRSELITHFLNLCLGEVRDDGSQQVLSGSGDNPTYIFDTSLANHTHFIPDVLSALDHIARSPHTPAPLLRHVIDRLSDHFGAVVRWEVVWAPGNIMQLGKLLASLASQPSFPNHLRRRVASALEVRLSQPDMARQLALVLAADGDGELAAHAARAAHTIIGLHAEDRYLDDERGELASALCEFLAIGDFGDDDAVIRNRLATTLSSLKRHCRVTTRERLRDILDHQRSALGGRLSWAFEEL